MKIEKKNPLVEILKNAETLEKAFKVLESKGMFFVVQGIKNRTEKILLAQKDYAIIKEFDPHYDEEIHPYGTEIVYSILEQKK